MVKVFIEASGRRIAPFDDPPGEAMVGNRTLTSWQSDMIRDAGLTQVNVLEAPCLVIPDTLFTTGTVLARFVRDAGTRNAVLVLKESRFAQATTPVQPGVAPVDGGWRFESIRFVDGSDAPQRDVVIDPEEEIFEIKLPIPGEGDDGPIEIPLARQPVMTLHHWVHVLWANQAAQALEARQESKARMVLRVLWAILRAASLNKWKIAAKLSRIGRGCDIHPTALVEASSLGDNVTVGPGARVLASRIGDGATIMSGAQVEFCTIGAGASVTQMTALRLCVLYPQSFAGQQLMQACVLGRGAFTTLGAFSIDLNFDQDVRVFLDGALHSTGTRFLGAAFGHGCRVGTGMWLASGRALPNGSFIMREPEKVISKVPSDPGDGRPWVNQGGALALYGDPPALDPSSS